MPLTFPLTREAFQAALPVAAVQFRLSEPIETARLGDGTVLSASLGAALWTGTIRLARRGHRAAMASEALIGLLQRPGASVLLHDPRVTGPAGDPEGAILGAAIPVLHAIAANARELRLAGLPAGYVLTPGDMLGFAYGASPLRHALHRLVTGAVADAEGLTPFVEVIPRLRPGAVTGTAVTLVRPFCKAVLLPDPDYGSAARALTEGATFGFIQTLR